MTKPRISRIFDLGAQEEQPLESPPQSLQQLHLPTLDERVSFYLRAVHGRRDFGNREYSDARNLLLDRMAADIAERSTAGSPEKPTFRVPSEYPNLHPEADALYLDLDFSPKYQFDEMRSELPSILEDSDIAPGPSSRRVSIARAEVPCGLSENAPVFGVAPAPRPDNFARVRSAASAAPAYKRAMRPAFIYGAGTIAAVAAFCLVMVLPISWFAQNPKSLGSRVAEQSSSPEPFEAKLQLAGPKQVETTAAPVGVMPLGATDSLIRRLVDPAEVADLLKRGRELVAAGNIPAARVLLKRAAEAGDASAALELGGTYDPIVFKELRGNLPSSKGKPAPSIKQVTDKARDPGPNMATAPDIPMARLWYQTAKDLGSVEASIRLERLSGADQ
jgi:hypothetical protein